MLCPDCKHNAFEPVYAQTLNPYLDDHPLTRDTFEPTRQEPCSFQCQHCGVYYIVRSNESSEQAYRRIICDFSKD